MNQHYQHRSYLRRRESISAQTEAGLTLQTSRFLTIDPRVAVASGLRGRGRSHLNVSPRPGTRKSVWDQRGCVLSGTELGAPKALFREVISFRKPPPTS